MQLDQLLQAVVAIDDAAIQVIQIGCCESAAIQWHQRTKFRRDHRDDIQNHPLRLVSGLAEAFHHAQALGELQFLLLRDLGLHPLADVETETFDVDLLQQLFDAFGAHHRDEFAGKLLIQLALALIGDHFALAQVGHFTRIDNHECFEIQDAFELAQSNVQQVTDAAGQALEEPDVGARAGQFDMAQALAPHPRQSHFHAAFVANDAAMFHALVLSAQTFPVGDGTENPGAEKSIALRLEGPVVDRFGLGYFTMGPASDLFRRRERDPDGIEVGDQICSIVRRGTIHEFSYKLGRG